LRCHKLGIGSAVQSAITATIDRIGSTLTITPYTDAIQNSGYGGQVETNGPPVSEIAVPFEEIKMILKQKFGDLESGKFQLALKSTAVFEISGDTKYKVTWQSEVYDIEKPFRYSMDNTLVAWILTLSKRFD